MLRFERHARGWLPFAVLCLQFGNNVVATVFPAETVESLVFPCKTTFEAFKLIPLPLAGPCATQVARREVARYPVFRYYMRTQLVQLVRDRCLVGFAARNAIEYHILLAFTLHTESLRLAFCLRNHTALALKTLHHGRYGYVGPIARTAHLHKTLTVPLRNFDARLASSEGRVPRRQRH
jgi:hypothetical protein